MAPEYITRGAISAKSDVYSFGILVLEIITGKKCNDFCYSSSHTNLISYVRKIINIWMVHHELLYRFNSATFFLQTSRIWEAGNPLNILDTEIRTGVREEEILKMIHIGQLCVQDNPRDRPDMSFVVKLLGSDANTLPDMVRSSGFEIIRRTSNIEEGETRKHKPENGVASFATDLTTMDPR